MKKQTQFVTYFLSALVTMALLALAADAVAQVPTMISYQGRVLVDNTNFNGNGQFKFALVQGAGPTLLWKNDGSPGDAEPVASVSIPVSNGLTMTLLGDVPMTPIPASVFANSDVRLRVWFNGGPGFQQLTPDQRIVSVGYALMAANVPDGSITGTKLAASAISSTQLADSLDLGATGTAGRLDVYRTAAGGPAITLNGTNSSISTFGSDGLEQTRLHGTSFGELLLRNSLPNNATAVNLTAQGSTGGRLTLNNTNGSNRAILEGENLGGTLTLYTADGNVGSVLYGSEGAGSGALSLRNTNGSARFRAFGGPTAGSMSIYNSSGLETVDVAAEPAGSVTVRNSAASTRASLVGGGSNGGEVRVYEQDGTLTTVIHNVSDAGVVSVRNASGVETGYLWGRNNAGQTGGQLGLKNSSGTETITLNADAGGEGRIYTQVLTITGGSDLSENFNINEGTAEPGMIVSIDPRNPGELMLSREAYDPTVAGIVSGAGGVKPGMLMGQAGTKAHGKHPVALTGRVYCRVDASHGAVKPGDMITTSTTPGHGMKATDRERAFGSIIGKAMTSLDEGKGLVLVLVSLQ